MVKQLNKRERARIERLQPALDAQRRADMASFADARAALDRIHAAKADLSGDITANAAALDGSDLRASAAYSDWRRNAQKQLLFLKEKEKAVSAALEKARERLLRSNGEVEAVKRLLGRGSTTR